MLSQGTLIDRFNDSLQLQQQIMQQQQQHLNDWGIYYNDKSGVGTEMTPNKGTNNNIKEPHDHNVLSGKGRYINYHKRNKYFRKLVEKYKLEYVKSPKQQQEKNLKARNPPGQFLRQDKDTKKRLNIKKRKVLDKCQQARCDYLDYC